VLAAIARTLDSDRVAVAARGNRFRQRVVVAIVAGADGADLRKLDVRRGPRMGREQQERGNPTGARFSKRRSVDGGALDKRLQLGHF